MSLFVYLSLVSFFLIPSSSRSPCAAFISLPLSINFIFSFFSLSFLVSFPLSRSVSRVQNVSRSFTLSLFVILSISPCLPTRLSIYPFQASFLSFSFIRLLFAFFFPPCFSSSFSRYSLSHFSVLNSRSTLYIFFYCYILFSTSLWPFLLSLF